MWALAEFHPHQPNSAIHNRRTREPTSILKSPAVAFLLALGLLAASWSAAYVWRQLTTPESLVLVIEPMQESMAERSLRVLQARLARVGAVNTRAERRSDGLYLGFKFPYGRPSPTRLEFLTRAHGSLRVFDPVKPDEIWLTEAGIGRVEASVTDPIDAGAVRQIGSLAVQTTPEAGDRLQRLSRASQGHRLQILFDGQAISEARVAGAFQYQVELPLRSVDEATDIAIVLASGPLPERAVRALYYPDSM